MLQISLNVVENTKKIKEDFKESVENNAEILVTFLDENRHVRTAIVTTRPLALCY